MTTLLHLDSSARSRDAGSFSRELSRELVDALTAATPGTDVVYRDLDAAPLPFVNGTWIAAAFSSPDTHADEHRDALSVSDEVIDEVVAADVLVLGVPVYNFTVPAAFKAWIDQLARVGRTFRYGPTGPQGLLSGEKKVYVVATSGSDFTSEQLRAVDFHEPYVRAILGFLGVTDVTYLRHSGAEPAQIEASLTAVRSRIAELAGRTPVTAG